MNLLQETIEMIHQFDLEIKDIVFIGESDGKKGMGWGEFVSLANREYDDGYGSAEVNTYLSIVFKCGAVMRRSEYDGSEWWEVRKPFVVPSSYEKMDCVFYKDYH